MATRDEVVEIVREMPGLNAGQIIELMPHVNKQSVHSALNWFYNSGKFRRELTTTGNNGKPSYAWFLNSNGQAPVHRSSASKAERQDAIVSGLKQRIADLEQWKLDAIKRYPDLGVDPIILRARKIVAAELRVTNDPGDIKSADAIMNGERDGVLAMRLVIKMLEGEAA